MPQGTTSWLQVDAIACGRARAVDALLQWLGGAAVLEVDGPRHFVTNTATGNRSQLEGATILRNSALRRAGLHAIPVPVTDRSRHELQ